MPASLFNRTADNWRPLFAIAQAIGGSWWARLEKAVMALEPEDPDAEGIGIQLLADVRIEFEAGKARNVDKMSSQGLCDALAKDPAGPWAEYKRGKPVSQKQLANLLKPFGIKPHNVRLGNEIPKGYERGDFEEAWERYLPAIASVTGAPDPLRTDGGWSAVL
jgi:hypothetical protein